MLPGTDWKYLHTGAVLCRALYNLHQLPPCSRPPGPETPCRVALSVSTCARMQWVQMLHRCHSPRRGPGEEFCSHPAGRSALWPSLNICKWNAVGGCLIFFTETSVKNYDRNASRAFVLSQIFRLCTQAALKGAETSLKWLSLHQRWETNQLILFTATVICAKRTIENTLLKLRRKERCLYVTMFTKEIHFIVLCRSHATLRYWMPVAFIKMWLALLKLFGLKWPMLFKCFCNVSRLKKKKS